MFRNYTLSPKCHIAQHCGHPDGTDPVERALSTLKIEDSIEDILITLSRQYHIIRVLERGVGFLFLYVALDRERSNLALARHNLKRIERELSF